MWKWFSKTWGVSVRGSEEYLFEGNTVLKEVLEKVLVTGGDGHGEARPFSKGDTDGKGDEEVLPALVPVRIAGQVGEKAGKEESCDTGLGDSREFKQDFNGEVDKGSRGVFEGEGAVDI